MNKALFFLFCLFGVACTNTNHSSHTITGLLSNSSEDTLYLEKIGIDGVETIDTTILSKEGSFSFNDTISEVGFYRIKLSDQNFAMLILDVGQKVNITGDADDLGNTYKAEGSYETTELIALNDAAIELYKKQDSLKKVFESYIKTVRMDSLKADSMSRALEAPYNKLMEEHQNYLASFVEKNSGSFVTIAGVLQLDQEKYFYLYKRTDSLLFQKYPNSSHVLYFHDEVSKMKTFAVGAFAPEIELPSTNEKTIALSSLKGKYVLIDFWASWCAPCRAENPNLVKTYQKFKNKNFEIIAVSLDKEDKDWKEAIEKDHLNWLHVSDLAYWNSDAAKKYGVKSIPSNFLLDKEGKIIAKNLFGNALDKKLTEVLQ